MIYACNHKKYLKSLVNVFCLVVYVGIVSVEKMYIMKNVVSVVFQSCFSGHWSVSVVLQWCCSCVSVLFQWTLKCFSGVSMVLRLCFSSATVVFHWCYIYHIGAIFMYQRLVWNFTITKNAQLYV